MAETAVGRRVQLVRCTDPYTRLEPGEYGTVGFIDAIGTVHVKWDNGTNLGLVPGKDEWRVLDLGEISETLRVHFAEKYPEISAARLGSVLHNVIERAFKKEFRDDKAVLAAIEAGLKGAS